MTQIEFQDLFPTLDVSMYMIGIVLQGGISFQICTLVLMGDFLLGQLAAAREELFPKGNLILKHSELLFSAVNKDESYTRYVRSYATFLDSELIFILPDAKFREQS